MGGVFPMMKQWMAAATFLSLASFAATSHASTILCTVIADGTSGKILKQQGNCDQRITAASTFKIALSLMGYDAGYLTDELFPALPFREGYPDWRPRRLFAGAAQPVGFAIAAACGAAAQRSPRRVVT